jgi:hypothetical protein
MTKKTIFQKRPKSMVAVNKKLWASCQAWAKRTYDVHPSAYSNSAAVKRYNKLGGKWRKPSSKLKKKAMKIETEIKESDLVPPFSRDEAELLVERMGIDLEELDTTLDEFLKGINIELEHRFLTHGDPSDTAMIAFDHLREDPEYYTKLSEMEGDAETEDQGGDKSPHELTLDDELAMISDFFDVEHHEAVDKLYEMLEDDNVRIAKPLGGLGYWHKKEKWVDISRKDKSGKHPPCGRSDASKGGKPRCRPASEAAKLSAADKKSESEKKRKVERTKKRKGKKPHMVKFDYMKKKSEDTMSFKKIAADLTSIADAADSKGKEAAARAVDELNLRLLTVASQLAAVKVEAPSSHKVAGLMLNDGHSVSRYDSADALERAVVRKTLRPQQIVAAVSDALYGADMLDAQAELAAAGKTMIAAIKIAKSAGLIH